MTSYYYFRKAVEWKRKMPTRGWWHMRNTPESLMNLLRAWEGWDIDGLKYWGIRR